jgi:MFS family permease
VFLAEIVPKKDRGTIFGIYFTLGYLTTGIITPALGGIADLYGFNVGFTILSIIIPMSILVLSKVRPAKSAQLDNIIERTE